MKKTNIVNTMTRTVNKIGFQFKKHSPELLVITGVVGVVASAVMACRATTKVSDILEKAKKEVDTIHECVEKPEQLSEEYTVEDSKKDLAIVYAHTGLQFAKIYAPSVILGTLSITSILAGHNILHKRNVALAAAYATVDKGFKDYRSRVIERFGEALDKELKYNIKAKEVEEIIVDENGEEQTVKSTVEIAEINQHSDYARIFDESCTGWSKDAEYNLYFLKKQERFANDLLQSRGHLFLNEVYDMLGIPRSKVGQTIGWIYDENDPTCNNYVDFGIYDPRDERKCAFVNGYERNIIIDPNVDGYIYDYMQ